MKLPNLPRATHIHPESGRSAFKHDNGDVAFSDMYDKLQKKYVKEASSDKEKTDMSYRWQPIPRHWDSPGFLQQVDFTPVPVDRRRLARAVRILEKKEKKEEDPERAWRLRMIAHELKILKEQLI